MLFGILPPYRTGVCADPAWMAAFARHAESVGFESLYTVEHVVVMADYDARYPYAESGRMPLPEDCPIPDPLDLLAYLAGVTERIVLGTGIVVLPEHHPVQLAKRLATIDVLSGGRMRLGVGVGWMREELEAMDVEFESRGARTDETIEAMRALWGHDEASFHGRFFDFERAVSRPRPARAGGVPIHIGGHSKAAARRAGRYGDGFQPLGVDEETLVERLALMRSVAAEHGRDPDAIELSLGGLIDMTGAEQVAKAAQQGAVRMVISTREGDLDVVRDQMSAFADRHIHA
jgi:probable F420-dependent oxidoreductase